MLFEPFHVVASIQLYPATLHNTLLSINHRFQLEQHRIMASITYKFLFSPEASIGMIVSIDGQCLQVNHSKSLHLQKKDIINQQ